MDDTSYRLNFNPGKKNEIYSTTARKSILKLVKLQRLVAIFVLRAEKITTFEPKVAKTSARNANVYKICKLRTAIFSSFYNISRLNFVILLILLRCSF